MNTWVLVVMCVWLLEVAEPDEEADVAGRIVRLQSWLFISCYVQIVTPASEQTLRKTPMAACRLLPQPLLRDFSTVVALPQTALRSAGFGCVLF